mgnify:CR=1 FL=1
MFEICKRKEEKMIEILDIKDAEPNKVTGFRLVICRIVVVIQCYLQLRINLDKEVSARLHELYERGKTAFYTNEKEFCSELTSSKLSESWKPIAWMPLPECYKETE